MIPEAAVEAAAELISTVDYPGYMPDKEFARKVLEAAAPHMLAGAWDEADRDYIRRSSVGKFTDPANPYRPTQ